MREIQNIVREMMEWLITIVGWIVIGILIVVMLAAVGIGYLIWVILLVVIMVFALLQNLIIGVFGKHK